MNRTSGAYRDIVIWWFLPGQNRLTRLGETLVEPLHALCLWAERHFETILESR